MQREILEDTDKDIFPVPQKCLRALLLTKEVDINYKKKYIFCSNPDENKSLKSLTTKIYQINRFRFLFAYIHSQILYLRSF